MRGRFVKLMLVLSVVFLSACSKEILLRDLSERDANEIIAVLSKNSVMASKVADSKGKSFAVEVNKEELAGATSILNALGYPKKTYTNLQEVFKPSGFAPTPFEERMRYIFGIAQELERTISLMNGVIQTRVHVAMPERDSRKMLMSDVKASVFVSYDDRYDMRLEVPRIRKLVSDSIDGLMPNNIEIVISPSRIDLQHLAKSNLVSFLGVHVVRGDVWLLATQMGALVMVIIFLACLLLDRYRALVITTIKSWFKRAA